MLHTTEEEPESAGSMTEKSGAPLISTSAKWKSRTLPGHTGQAGQVEGTPISKPASKKILTTGEMPTWHAAMMLSGCSTKSKGLSIT